MTRDQQIDAAIKRRRPRPLDDNELVQIEEVLSLDTPNERLRERLNSVAFDYLWVCQHRPANEAAVSERLKKIKAAAEKLRTLIKDPINPGAMMRDSRAVERPVSGLILRETDIDADDLSEKLARICSFIETRKKDKGGWRGYESWNEMMLEVAAIYREATGKRATVTESKYTKKYTGPFVEIATIIDKATATSAKTQPRPNSALGPALRRLIEPRKPTSKTPR